MRCQMSRLLRVNISEAEQRQIRLMAVERGEGIADFIGRALRVSPVTRKAFQTKETQK
jgi:hypothetical protein